MAIVDFIDKTRDDSTPLTNHYDRMNRLRNDATLLGVAKTLVNIGGIENRFNSNVEGGKGEEAADLINTNNLMEKSKNTSYDEPLVKLHSISTICNDPSSFPLKLMEVLSDKNHKEIISWLAHGRGFMIFQTKEFVANVMPKYFKQTKFPSFTRKLSRWGFNRVQRGEEIGVYYHELFNRDNPQLCLRMRSLRGRLGKSLKIDRHKLSSKLEKQDYALCSQSPPHDITRDHDRHKLSSKLEKQDYALCSQSPPHDITRDHDRHKLSSKLEKQDYALRSQSLSHNITRDSEGIIGLECIGNIASQQDVKHQLKNSIERNGLVAEHYTYKQDTNDSEKAASLHPNDFSSNIESTLPLVSSSGGHHAVHNDFSVNIESTLPLMRNSGGHCAVHPLCQSNPPENVAYIDQNKAILRAAILSSCDRNQNIFSQPPLCQSIISPSSLSLHFARDAIIKSALQQIGLKQIGRELGLLH